MQVFVEVRRPRAHNWATIRHGDAKQAICLYREMLDKHTCYAVSKACATADDSATGDVHPHVLAVSHTQHIYAQLVFLVQLTMHHLD